MTTKNISGTKQQCVVLAAGEGTRMRPLTGSRPKVMIPIANRPMLEHLLCACRESGITEFVLVVGYKEQAIREYFGDGTDFGIQIQYVRQTQQAGTADALLAAKPHVRDRFLMINGDMLLSCEDITKVLQSKSPAIGICTVADPRKYGIVTIEKEDNASAENVFVTSFEEKSDKPLSSLINCGIYSFDTDIFEHLARVTPSPRGELELVDALMPFIQSRSLRAIETPSWVDLGSPWDLLDVNMSLLHAHIPHIASDAVIEDGVYLHGNVSIGSGTIVKSGTYIEGPCIIGNNSKIGPHVYIRGTTAIGDNCHIGHSTEMKNSILFSNSNLPHFNYVGDTIIGSGCNFGAGTKVANLRHDKAVIKVGGISTGRKKFGAVIGDNVLFGINCAVNVGTRIGNHCSFAPGAQVHGDIFDGTVYRE